MTKIKIFFIILSILLSSCGYKIVNKSNVNYNIADITTNGDPRINYKIKNRILFNKKEGSKNNFVLNIFTEKKRIIKDKNIKNEVTSYNLVISSDVTYKIIGRQIENKFNVTQSGDYKVSKQRLDTLNSEKSLTQTLTENIISKIETKLNNLSNDY